MADIQHKWEEYHVNQQEYILRNGLRARVLMIAEEGDYPIIGVYWHGGWLIATWRRDGLRAEGEHGSDLMPPAPVKNTLEFWVNVYSSGRDQFNTREEADKCAVSTRTACLHIIREYEEGEGL